MNVAKSTVSGSSSRHSLIRSTAELLKATASEDLEDLSFDTYDQIVDFRDCVHGCYDEAASIEVIIPEEEYVAGMCLAYPFTLEEFWENVREHMAAIKEHESSLEGDSRAMTNEGENSEMTELALTLTGEELPRPGEIYKITKGGFDIFIENTSPPSEDPDEDEGSLEVGQIVGYVPVSITAPSSMVRHAAAVYQRPQRTRVFRWTLCDRSGTRQVKRRLDDQPLTNVTCAQCRRALVYEGLLSE